MNNFEQGGLETTKREKERTPEELKKRIETLEKALGRGGHRIKELKEESMTDELTGLPNKRGLERKLQEVYSQILETGSERRKQGIENISLVVFDMDGLKQINDSYGHNIGDKAIIALAEYLKSHLRKIDTLGRCGEKADEFVAIVPNVKKEELEKKLSQINEELSRLTILADDGSEVSVGASFGFVVVDKANKMPLEEARKVADINMYENKRKRAEEEGEMSS